ncbi:MAG: efflux RND transporter periplasmic adaptor subunit [Candidatus Eremiobacteraeota bacterium]|nr:efflux RND transporter periplasmic adaptor subunit [Candidatus Eremiobacteraeota bacterium]
MKKIIPLLILVIVGIVTYFYVKQIKASRVTPANIIEVTGSIETTEVDVSFQVPGQIARITVEEGDKIKKGDVLATLDERDLRQKIKEARASRATVLSQLPQLETKIKTSDEQEKKQLAQARTQIDQARYQWISLKKGSRDEDIAKAEYAIDQARHSFENASKNYERAELLYKDGAMPAQQRDSYLTAHLTAQDQLRQSKETYRLLLAGPREEDIEAARARVDQAEASYNLIKVQSLQTKQLVDQKGILGAQVKQAEEVIRSAQVQLSHSKAYAPIDGVVLIRAKEPGEVVSASTPVLTVANIEDVYLKAYIGNNDFGKVKLGQKVRITIDSSKNVFEGTIYYISDEAEFTPKSVQTKEDRVKLVYRIKARVENKSQELKPGMIADGTIDISTMGPEKK